MTYAQRERQRRIESVSRIQDDRIPSHHLSTSEQKCRRDFDSIDEPTWDRPIVRHYCSYMSKYKYREFPPVKPWSMYLNTGRGCWQNRFYPTGVGEEGIHPDKYKFNRVRW